MAGIVWKFWAPPGGQCSAVLLESGYKSRGELPGLTHKLATPHNKGITGLKAAKSEMLLFLYEVQNAIKTAKIRLYVRCTQQGV